ncbi:MAG TPA: hypothetical protein VGV15_17040 [Terriglobales bacterium]|nr:hypothetical protein [Terriglobales bacterium]
MIRVILPGQLRGTIRDHIIQQRRPFLRFFACEEDLSHQPPDAPLPGAVASGTEPLIIIGALAGGPRAAPLRLSLNTRNDFTIC